MAESLEEAVFLERSARVTRGKRMTKLLDEEAEEDELFWNQEALNEEENDTNYVEEAEVVDEFDSDFDEDEPEPDEDGEKDAEKEVKTKKKLIFPGKTIKKKKSKKKDLAKLENDSNDKDEESVEAQKPKNQVQLDAPEDLEGERSVRKSTRTSVIVRQAEREAIRAALQATMKPVVKRKKEGEEKRMTQEEMLLEAAQTEIMNLRNLERVLAREEEVKKRAIVHKEVYTGPQIRFHSTDGLPAKYRDPKTGLPYATLDAFKIIRERFLKEEDGKRKRQKLDMGPLFDSLLGQGFSSKQKRSEITRTSDLRLGARFRRIPTHEIYTVD